MRKRVDLRLPESLVEAVDERAALKGWSRTQVIERAVLSALGLESLPARAPVESRPPESPLVRRGSDVDDRAAAEVRRAKLARQERLNRGK